jgi:hypothetical protein
MQFQHRTFNIECTVEVIGGGYIGQVTISNLPSDEEQGKAFESGPLRSFPARAQAIGHVRF